MFGTDATGLWWVAGITAVGTTAGLVWRHVRTAVTYLAGVLVQRAVLCDTLTINAARNHLRDNFKSSPFRVRSYESFHLYVASRRREMYVPYERIGSHGSIFWQGWWPVWVRQLTAEEHRAVIKDSESVGQPLPLCLACLRGTFDLPQFVSDIMHAASTRYDKTGGGRFRVEIKYGNAQLPRGTGPRSTSESSQNGLATYARLMGLQPLGYVASDLGRPERQATKLASLSLNYDATQLVSAAKRWLGSEHYYHERSIPWKFGFHLTGAPGNGKTALLRALAYALDVPVYVIDLGTFTNAELRVVWQQAQGSMPAMVVIEEIDNVFHGRENITEGKYLTFDTLLDLIDGVSPCNGLIVAITTNHPEHLDAALIRPGRCGRSVVMGPPDQAGRRIIADRFLHDHPQVVHELVSQSRDGISGAEFESLCLRRAEELYLSLADEAPAAIPMKETA